MKRMRVVPFLVGITYMGTLTHAGNAQSAADEGSSSNTAAMSFSWKMHAPRNLTYTRPNEKTKIRNYFFDAFRPYPVAGAAILGAVNQAHDRPPKWGQGFETYGERVGSHFGISLATTTTRYALAEAFREDTLYYGCGGSGVFRRMEHAAISTVTARHGADGHRRLSFPALIAPYAGATTAIYGWYPDRYSVKDSMRMGNYALLGAAAGNIAREFLYGGPHTLLRQLDRPGALGADSTENASNH